MARNPKRFERARALRKADVPAESLLWKALRNRVLAGFKFRRRHPIGPYIVDFACVEARLIVEADGASHLPRQTPDLERTHFLQDQGWLVIRFWNTQIYDELDAVKEAIYQACVERTGTSAKP